MARGLRALSVLLLAFLVFGTPAALAAQPRTPTLAPSSTVIDGPSGDIVSLTGMSVARDGTGGVAYVKNVQGIPHIFVSRLLAGRFGAPVQVDAGLAGPSSQPVIAASNPGLLVVAFINGGTLYATQAAGVLTQFTAPVALAGGGASNPSLSMSTLGKAYVAFTVAGAGGDDVRAAYYYQGVWGVEGPPLDANPADDAGSATGRPSMAASGDGEGIVAWGESGHIFTRRIWGTVPSVAFQQADPGSVSGIGEISADEPEISTGGDSSYAAVVFREIIGNSATQQSRVLMNRLHAGRYDGIAPVDGGLGFGDEGADQPQVAATEFGRGFITSETNQTHNITLAPLSNNEQPTITERVNSQILSAAPDAVPAVAGTVSTMIAWQEQPGSLGLPEIRLRYAPNGSDLNPEQIISSSSLGPTNADAGLAAGGDLSGDAVVSWVQGTGPNTLIVAGQLYQAPGNFGPQTSFRYATSANPILAWSPSAQLWGPPQYNIKLDGVQIAQTSQTTIRSPVPVADGRHTWQATAVNQAGLSTAAGPATVFVDTVRPKVSFRLKGTRVIGSTLRITIRDTDSPPPVPTAVSSGIKSVQVKWGDGIRPFIHKSTAMHVYKHRRRYVVTVIVKDWAGNRTIVTKRIKIRGTVPRQSKEKSKGKPRPKPGAGGAQAVKAKAKAKAAVGAQAVKAKAKAKATVSPAVQNRAQGPAPRASTTGQPKTASR